MLGTPNEDVLKKAVGPQIADLYGTTMRSTPVFFLQDDHDYFETDEADDTLVTLPPDPFMLNLARASQLMYYPEFLPDAHRGLGLPSGSAADRPAGVSESFGTLRYGRLLEMLMYDCRRYVTLTGPSATFVPPLIEDWLKARMANSDAIHVVNMPSIPPGWSAGKWGEWYADMDGGNQQLTTSIPKPYWQSGWRLQHDRLLQAASAMRGRVPLFISGDLHSIARGAHLQDVRDRSAAQPRDRRAARTRRHRATRMAIARARAARTPARGTRRRGGSAGTGGKWLHHCRLHARARDAALLQVETWTARRLMDTLEPFR